MLAYLDRMIADGYGRNMTVGAFSTGIVGGGAGTIFDQNQPEFAVGVPAGYQIRPIHVEIVVQGGLATTDSDETEALLAVDSLGLWRGDGTLTIEQASNLNGRFAKGSVCRLGSAFTADMTTVTLGGAEAGAEPVLDMELARVAEDADLQGTAANMVYRQIRLVYEPNYPPFVGPNATLLGYWGGTRATIGGFATVRWVEAPIDIMVKYMKGEL